MLPENKLETVAEWLTMKQSEVLDRFHSIPTAYSDGKKQNRFVYIPGTRQDRVLLVAHSDTVWGDTDIKLAFDTEKKIISSENKTTTWKEVNKFGYENTRTGVGINADDRAGCAILWHLKGLGHSLLITSGEEQGCITAKGLAEDDYWNKELNETHQFAIEFDRRGEDDIVFYDIGTKKFAEFIKEQTKYKPQSGSSTDIKHFCKKICGVNFSVGYNSEHQSSESLNLNHWFKTLETVHKLLEQKELPKFSQDPADKFTTYSSCGYTGNGYNHNDHWPYRRDRYSYDAAKHESVSYVSSGEQVRCKGCYNYVSYEDWFDNMFRCIKCGREM